MLKKKIWANFQRMVEVFTQKNVQYALKYMGLGSGIRDPGSGKNLFRIPDPGVKKAPDPGSGSATLDPRSSPYSFVFLLYTLFTISNFYRSPIALLYFILLFFYVVLVTFYIFARLFNSLLLLVFLLLSL
jgi:hypothetical protein